MSPLSKLNKVFGAYLRAEATATEMELVVDLKRSGLGSIVSYCETKTSEGEADDDSEGMPDDVYEIKKAIYRAVHGNNENEVNAEKMRRFIDDKVKNSRVTKPLVMGFETNRLLMHILILNLYFVADLLSELSILEISRRNLASSRACKISRGMPTLRSLSMKI